MKDKKPKFEEIEASLTLDGVVIHTQIRQSHGREQIMSVWVVITDAPPVYKYYRGGGERGECGLKSVISAVIHN